MHQATQRLSFLAGLFLGPIGTFILIEALLFATPGDAIDLLSDSDYLRPLLEAEWGLDKPMLQRIFWHLGRVVSGDLGTSLIYRPGMAVADLVESGLKSSFMLVMPAFFLSGLLGLVLGWLGLDRRWLRGLVQAVSVIPGFLMAFLMVLFLNGGVWALMEVGWLDRPEWFALPDQESYVKTGLAICILTLSSGNLAETQAIVGEELARIRDAAYVRATRARGEGVFWVVLQVIIGPLLELTAGRLAVILGGLVVVEKLLLFNGAGAMLFQACKLRDYPLVGGLALGLAATVWGARLVALVSRMAVDPRWMHAE